MEPWHAPAPHTRAYCITEVYHTQKSGAQFDVVMSSARSRRRSRRRSSETSARSRRAWPRWTCAPPRASSLRRPHAHPGRAGAGRGLRHVQHAGHRPVEREPGRAGAGGTGAAASGRAGDISALIDNLGRLLKKMGQLNEARVLLRVSWTSQAHTVHKKAHWWGGGRCWVTS